MLTRLIYSVLIMLCGCVNSYEIKAKFQDRGLVPNAVIETKVTGHSQIRDTALVYERVMQFLNSEFFKPMTAPEATAADKK